MIVKCGQLCLWILLQKVKMLQEKKQVKKAVFDVEAADLGGVEAPGDKPEVSVEIG